MFVDLFCGDARQEYFMWKGLKADASKLAPADVGLQFHVLVEPFHPWSFTAAVGAQTAAAYGSSDAFFSFAEACWTNSGDFVQHWDDQNYPTANLTETQVISKMAAFASAAKVELADFMSGMTK